MNKIVVDNSVLVKWFFEESNSEMALELMRLIASGTILCLPEIAPIELVNSIKFGKKTKPEKARTVIEEFFNLEPELVATNLDFSLKISSLIHNSEITAYDATYIAVANEKDIPLFTADYKHHQKSISKNIVWLKEWNGKL